MMHAALLIIVGTFSLTINSAELDKVDLNHNYVLAVMPLPQSNRLLVSFLDERTNQVGFSICKNSGSNFEQCEINKKLQTPFSADKMNQLRVLFLDQLDQRDPSAYELGLQAGILNSLGLPAQSVGGYLGLPGLVPQTAISRAVQEHYAYLFNSDINTPRFVAFESSGGLLTGDSVLEALAGAIERLPL